MSVPVLPPVSDLSRFLLRAAVPLALAVALSGCQVLDRMRGRPGPAPEAAAPAAPGEAPTVGLSEAMPPPVTSSSPEKLDTSTDAEKAEAAAPSSGGTSLGTTIASLGDPAAAGFWLETPLVKAAVQGRVVDTASGTSAKVELRPIPGEPGSGSRISLAAMRVLGLSLTDLPELEVFRE